MLNPAITAIFRNSKGKYIKIEGNPIRIYYGTSCYYRTPRWLIEIQLKESIEKRTIPLKSEFR